MKKSKIKHVNGSIAESVFKYYEDKKQEESLTSHVVVNIVERLFTDCHGELDQYYLMHHYGVLKTNFVLLRGFYLDLTDLDCDDPEIDKEVVYEIVTFLRFIKKNIDQRPKYSEYSF